MNKKSKVSVGSLIVFTWLLCWMIVVWRKTDLWGAIAFAALFVPAYWQLYFKRDLMPGS